MPGPTTERLDDDFRSLRDDMQDIKIILARMDAKLTALDEDVRSNTVGLAALDARVGTLDARVASLDARVGFMDARLSWLFGAGKWLGSLFALAAIYGVINISGRLGIVETQLRSVDGRLGSVEIQMRSVDGRLGVVETQIKNVDAQLSEMRGAFSRRQPDLPAELEERINRIARAAVDEAIKRAILPKPSP